MPPKDETKNLDAQKLSAVVIAESFEPRFNPITSNKSLGQLEICDVRAIDYSLRWIARCDVANVVIVVSEKHAPAYQDIESSWKGIFDSVIVVICQNSHSIGDALREVESRNVLTGHFLLVPSPVSFCSSTLQNPIKAFKLRFKKDKNAVMSLIYSESRVDGTCVALNESGRMIAFHSQSDPSKLDSETEEFGDSITIRKDVIDTGMAICSLQALAHYSDNFDFQTRDEVIRHILINEDIMLQYVNVDILPSFESAVSVFDYSGLIRSNGQLISRLFFPLFPLKSKSTVLMNSGNVITSGRQRVRIDGWNAFIGEDVTVGTHTFVMSSSIGKKCRLGCNSRIVESIVGEGSVVGEGVSLHQVFLAENVTIDKGQIIPNKVVIGPNVRLNGSIRLTEGSLISCSPPNDDMEEIVKSEKLAEEVYAWSGKMGGDWWSGEWVGMEEEDGDEKGEEKKEKEGEDEEEEEGEGDVEKQFTTEILDSLNATLHLEKISTDTVRKMIVEINSSKIAYNISMNRVASLLFVAFLRLPHNEKFSTIKQRVTKYYQLFKNYYSEQYAQFGLLKGLNEFYSLNRDSFSALVAKIIHHLFEVDILSEESILGWHANLDENDPVIPLVKQLIEWLEESDEEDEDEEEED
ncbi:hypothetical protein PENTCL1PPCAC_6439 [Pristionchus entomophagus]|uniref:Translation initiation factor eIF2B subunit epsilon n=1 Tax=Pristionchus entomophagus TaxID=358040 RepID=A0AAV5SVJ9_9BILA|nr:hypothetical protein PENTCL1PPCAC_6439 [Pristionchus entomophagus]